MDIWIDRWIDMERGKGLKESVRLVTIARKELRRKIQFRDNS